MTNAQTLQKVAGTHAHLNCLLTDVTKTVCGRPAAAPAAAAAAATPFTLSLYNRDTVNAAQFVQLMDLCLADCTDQLLIRRLATFVCEGFVESREERAIRRQQVSVEHTPPPRPPVCFFSVGSP